MDSYSKTGSLLERVRAVGAIIESEADLVEKQECITTRIQDALVEHELYWIGLPPEFGGIDADFETCFEVIEEISRADGSTGWCYFVNISSIGLILPFLDDRALAHIFPKGQRPIMAGQLVPRGRSEKVEGGYRCSGQHSFASGSAYANWICAAHFAFAGDKPVLRDDGTPQVTIAMMRSDEVVFRGNWDVMGLIGTSSVDFEIIDRIVPSARVLDGSILLPGAVPLRGSAMLRMGPLPIGLSLHTACVIGIVKRAMQELIRLTSTKTRAGYDGPIGNDPVFLNQFATLDADYHAVRGRVLDVFCKAEAKVEAGEPLTPLDRATMHQTCTWAHQKAVEIVSACFRWAGTTPIRNPNALGRCLRDMLVANSHLLFDQKSLTAAGPELARNWQRGG